MIKDGFYVLNRNGCKDVKRFGCKGVFLLDSFKDSIKSLILLDFQKTESGENVSAHIIKKILPTIQLSLFVYYLGSLSAIFIALSCIYYEISLLENALLF